MTINLNETISSLQLNFSSTFLPIACIAFLIQLCESVSVFVCVSLIVQSVDEIFVLFLIFKMKLTVKIKS